MVVEGGKIVKATDSELYAHWLRCGLDDIMSYDDYKRQCIALGVEAVEE